MPKLTMHDDAIDKISVEKSMGGMFCEGSLGVESVMRVESVMEQFKNRKP